MSEIWFYLVVNKKRDIVTSPQVLQEEEAAVDHARAMLAASPKETFYVMKAVKSVHRPDSLVEDTEDPEIPF